MTTVVYHQSSATLGKVESTVRAQAPGAYLRFGDGDVCLAMGSGELYQSSDPTLTSEMQQAFGLQGPGIIKSLPLCCKRYDGIEPGMFPGNHECPDDWCEDILTKVAQWWTESEKIVFCTAALHHTATQDPTAAATFLCNILKNVDWVLLAGNENIPDHVLDSITPNGKLLKHVKSPSSGSFSAIDRIEDESASWIGKQSGYGLVITSMGCSGRVLQKRLYNAEAKYYLFDFGSLMDAMCGWDTRAWISLTGFQGPKFLSLLQDIMRST